MVSKEQYAKEKRIIKGVKEILEFRGYEIEKTREDDDYLDVYGNRITEDGEKLVILARFPKNPQIGVKTIRTLGKLQQEEEIDNALLVAEAPLTHYAKKESVKLGIEIISSTNPLFNIFDHEMVPQHIKMTSKEIKSFLNRYQIAKYQIPKILETDPAIKAIQAKAGDVIKIIRNPAMGEHGCYYRVVIKSASRLRLSDTTKEKPKTTTKTKTEAKAKTTTKTKTEAKAKTTTKAKPKAKPKTTTKTKPKAKPKTTTKTKEEAKKKTATKAKAKKTSKEKK
ncbi:MAG: DNA-directed RNA polymerase subunit H [Candidatus Heimdallarchaeaceae archaeon]